MKVYDADVLVQKVSDKRDIRPSARMYALKFLLSQPTFEAVPITHGRWAVFGSKEDYRVCECPACHDWLYIQGGKYTPHFCCSCGFDLRKEGA